MQESLCLPFSHTQFYVRIPIAILCMDDKTKKAPSFTMVLQCNIAENYARYPDAVFSGPAKNRHDSCAIVGVVLFYENCVRNPDALYWY
jgi:hypothetical protein